MGKGMRDSKGRGGNIAPTTPATTPTTNIPVI